MKINFIKNNEPIKCDSVLCFNNADFELITNSFKGNTYLCDSCYKQYQKLFKETRKTNDN